MHYNDTCDSIYDVLANVFPLAHMGIDKVTLGIHYNSCYLHSIFQHLFSQVIALHFIFHYNQPCVKTALS